MKLYTEEQVDIMLSRARLQKQDDTYMFTNEYLLSQETPIELPSDEEIEKYIEKTFYGEKKHYFKAGFEFMKEQILKQNRLTINETKRSIEGIGLNNQNK